MSNIIEIDDNTFEKIEKYYLHGHKLSPHDHQICERWESAFALLLKHKIRSIACKKHAAVYKITERQAYTDIKNAERIFVPIHKYSKEFVRLTIIESAMRDVKSCEAMIKTKGEKISTGEWKNIMEIKDRAEKRVIKAAGLDMYDPNLPDFSKILPHVYEIRLPDEVKNMFKTVIGRGVVDITAMMSSMSQEATLLNDGAKDS
jgi:hypothetical protein